MKWSEANKELLDKMIKAKPEMFRKTALEEIRKRAEEISSIAGQDEVTPDALAEANYLSTPAEFRAFVEIDLKKMGFDPAAYKKEKR